MPRSTSTRSGRLTDSGSRFMGPPPWPCRRRADDSATGGLSQTDVRPARDLRLRRRQVDPNDGIRVIDAGSAQMLTPARSGLRDRLDYSPEGALRVAREEKAP